MVLLCVGALINWLGLAENYVEPVRYIGVACIVAGALLICAAMCCWLHSPPSRTNSQTSHANQPTTAQVRHFLFSVIGESVYLSWIEVDRMRECRFFKINLASRDRMTIDARLSSAVIVFFYVPRS
jgi:hypothetical protein